MFFTFFFLVLGVRKVLFLDSSSNYVNVSLVKELAVTLYLTSGRLFALYLGILYFFEDGCL